MIKDIKIFSKKDAYMCYICSSPLYTHEKHVSSNSRTAVGVINTTEDSNINCTLDAW